MLPASGTLLTSQEVSEGQIETVSEIPNREGRFLVRVQLPDGLTTTYHKPITYKAGMKATAEIVTEDLRLIERLFYDLRRIVKGERSG